LIRRWLLAKWLSRASHGMLNQKDLLTTSSASVEPPLRVLPGRRNAATPNLLIQKGLLSRWRWRGGERLLNLKDVLAVLLPTIKRVFESGPILKPLFLCKIVPNSAIFCQNAGEYGIKSFFTTDFQYNGPGPAAREPSQRAPNTSRPASRKHHKCLPYLAGGTHRISRAGRWLVTDMVKLRKLTLGFNCHFPPPIPHLGRERVLQTKWLFEMVSVFGRFEGYKIVPNFTIFYQKRAKTDANRHVKGS